MLTRYNRTIATAATIVALAFLAGGCARPLNEDDRKAMWNAVSTNDLAKVQRLVEEDIRRVNMITSRKDNYSALHHCVFYNKADTRLAEYLLQTGADPNTQTDSGWTALHTAVWDSSLAYVEVLLAHGADVNIKENNKGRSPLEMAQRSGATSHIAAAMERHLAQQALTSN